MRPRHLLALAPFALAACGDDPPAETLGIADECNPLGGWHFMAPWPSSAFEVDDPSTPTGRRLAIPAGTLPINIDGIPIDPTRGTAPTGSRRRRRSRSPSTAASPPPGWSASTTSTTASAPTARRWSSISPPASASRTGPRSTPRATGPAGDAALLIRPAARLASGHAAPSA
ncbi:MAG: hypothetical protein R2939_05080 [Kofleriaceae bacterium]